MKRLAQSLLDITLPPVCACCRRVGEIFCADCRANVQWVDQPICSRCGRPQKSQLRNCADCQQRQLPLEKIRAATLHTGPVRPVLHRMKYEGLFALAEPLGELMVSAWPRWKHQFDLVLPIPLHSQRFRERGYNQSELLVNVLQKKLGWHSDREALKRTRKTRPQLGLTAKERRVNVCGAFEADKSCVAGKRIMLVDDVCTTGSTLTSAAEALLEVGAHSVTAYCLTTATATRAGTAI